MSKEAKISGIREAVGVFMGADDVKRAGEALLAAGFDRTGLGLLAGKEAVESSLGDLYARANAFTGHPDATHQELVRHEAVGAPSMRGSEGYRSRGPRRSAQWSWRPRPCSAGRSSRRRRAPLPSARSEL